MKTYTFWNNKGGTGKTSLCFQCAVRYAQIYPNEKVLVMDLCPQANISELLCGGMVGNGADNLDSLFQVAPRKSVGGYFELRMRNPYSMPANVKVEDYISLPYSFNSNIPQNVSLVAGDRLVELQSSYIYTLATTNIPMQNTYATVLMWIKDFLSCVANDFDIVFIDTNPSFSIYTQIALAATEFLIIPVMADDSSKRALNNVLSLVYGFMLRPAYANNTFYNNMQTAGYSLPKIHMIVKNRLTQYMGPASSYYSVLQSIDNLIAQLQSTKNAAFSRSKIIEEVRDFQSTGVIAFAEAKSFNTLYNAKMTHYIGGKRIILNKSYIKNNLDDVDNIVRQL